MTKKIQITDERLARIYDIFRDHAENMTRADIAQKYGIAVSTVDKDLADARELIYEDLITNGKKHQATVFARYEAIYKTAAEHYNNTTDLNALKLMMQTLSKMSELLGLNAPPKATVNPDNDTSGDDPLIYTINDDAYKKAEEDAAKLREQAIEGTKSTIDIGADDAIMYSNPTDRVDPEPS